MPDYQKMYLIMMRAAEKAIRILVEAQQACEELYISAPEPENSLTQSVQSDIV